MRRSESLIESLQTGTIAPQVMDSGVKAELETSVTESQQNSGAGAVDDRVINCLIMMHSSVISTTLCSDCPSSRDEG